MDNFMATKSLGLITNKSLGRRNERFGFTLALSESAEMVELHARFFNAGHDSVISLEEGSLIVFEYILCFCKENIVVVP